MMTNPSDLLRIHERRIQELEREHALRWHDVPRPPASQERAPRRGRPILRLLTLLRIAPRPAAQRT